MDVVHGVVDGEAGSDGATRAVDVEVYRFRRVLSFEKEQLGDYQGRHAIMDRAVEANDAFLEEAREYVIWMQRKQSVIDC